MLADRKKGVLALAEILIVAIAVILLTGLLWAEKREKRTGMVPAKGILSSLFILAVVIQPHPIATYYRFLLAGLLFCLVGDVCLALPQKKAFLVGLASFLLGHILYILAFAAVAEAGLWALAGLLCTLVVSVTVYLRLSPHLGSMKLPVLLYVLVITVMLAGAWAVLGEPGLDRSGRVMIFAGALLFYVSDVFVARNRFVKKEFFNRLVGLPLYYAGQFLLAFSVGLTA